MYVFLTVAGVLLAIIIVLSLICFKFSFTRPTKRPDLSTDEGIRFMRLDRFKDIIMSEIKKVSQMPHEDVYIQSYDGLKLYGCLYGDVNSDTTIILFHGWISSSFNDFGCIIPYFVEKGYNVLAVSQRAHGESEGKYICMGVKEKYDCASWCRYAKERFGEEQNIFIEGLSMGASTVLFASGLDLPQNVRGIIADCGFTSPIDIVKSVAWSHHIFPYPIVWFVALWFRIFCGCSMYEDSTVKALQKNTRPILFIHGENDDFVPCSMGKTSYEACTSEKSIILVPEAGHGQSYLYDSKRCVRELDRFIDAHSKKH